MVQSERVDPRTIESLTTTSSDLTQCQPYVLLHDGRREEKARVAVVINTYDKVETLYIGVQMWKYVEKITSIPLQITAYIHGHNINKERLNDIAEKGCTLYLSPTDLTCTRAQGDPSTPDCKNTSSVTAMDHMRVHNPHLEYVVYTNEDVWPLNPERTGSIIQGTTSGGYDGSSSYITEGNTTVMCASFYVIKREYIKRIAQNFSSFAFPERAIYEVAITYILNDLKWNMANTKDDPTMHYGYSPTLGFSHAHFHEQKRNYMSVWEEHTGESIHFDDTALSLENATGQWKVPFTYQIESLLDSPYHHVQVQDCGENGAGPESRWRYAWNPSVKQGRKVNVPDR
jgi:hypothetical protein